MSNKIDEKYIMGLIAGDTPPLEKASTTIKEEKAPKEIETQSSPKERKGKIKQDECKRYSERFLTKREMRDRQQIYIGGQV